MVTVKDICTLFDKHYEQDGKDQKATVDKLKLLISEMYQSSDDVDENTKNWLVWMYGKVLNITSIEDDEIICRYNMIKYKYDRKSKELCEQFHFTSMYKVMSYTEE